MSKNTQTVIYASTSLDKLAIGLSLACSLHCLLLPVSLVLLPALASTTLGDEQFHRWMLLAVLPTSLIALTIGCMKHLNFSVIAITLPGLALLLLAAFFGHDMLGETGEKAVMLVGATLVALGHFRNQSLCKRHRCSC